MNQGIFFLNTPAVGPYCKQSFSHALTWLPQPPGAPPPLLLVASPQAQHVLSAFSNECIWMPMVLQGLGRHCCQVILVLENKRQITLLGVIMGASRPRGSP